MCCEKFKCLSYFYALLPDECMQNVNSVCVWGASEDCKKTLEIYQKNCMKAASIFICQNTNKLNVNETAFVFEK